MKQFIEKMNKYKYSGVNMLLFIKDEILESTSLGYASIENKTPLALDNIFRIASISKVVVALAIMKLVEEGKIDVEEDISKYLGYKVRNPHFPDDVIKVKYVMTQTSSISDANQKDKGYDGVNGPSMHVSLQDLLTNENYEYYTPKTYLNHKPGTYFEYSNFGCGILACIVEKVTGKYFTDYIREVVLLPLGLDASFRADDINNPDKIASLYYFEYDPPKLSRDKDMFMRYVFPRYPLGDNFRGPAGGLFISALDLMKIAQMLMNKGTYNGIQIFKKETVELMEKEAWRGIAEDDGSYKAKGLQLHLLELDFWPYKGEMGLKGHFGFAYGAMTFMFYTKDFGMIFFCSGTNSNTRTDGIRTMEYDAFEEILRLWKKHDPKRALLTEETMKIVRDFTIDRNWQQYHSGENLAKSLVLEASELLELYQWSSEVEDIERLKEELADVFVYALDILDKYNLDINEIIQKKMEKNAKKYPVDKAYGKSDKYTKL